MIRLIQKVKNNLKNSIKINSKFLQFNLTPPLTSMSYQIISIFLAVIQTRVMFLDKFGIYESNRKETIKNFIKSKTFRLHMASLFPLDLFYLASGFVGRASLLRIPRLIRSYHFEDLFERLDNALPYPMTIRLTRTINIMLYLIHLTSCAYYTYSDLVVSIQVAEKR